MTAKLFIALAAMSLPVYHATAQVYPSKPIRLVVPFAPGGSNDIIARTLGQKLTEKWGQQVVVDNRPGASGVIASEILARAAGDGYTIFLPGNNHAINVSLYSKLPYDSIKDFAPVTLVGSVPNMLVVHPSVPAKSVAELIALAKSKPSQINYTAGSTGNPAHLAGELFKGMAGIDLVHIPYKGGGPALVDVLGGQVPVMVISMPTALPSVKVGRLRALAVTSAKRSPSAPDVPTVSESLPGYESSVWFGVLAPAATPRKIVETLNVEIGKTLGMPDVRQRLSGLGVDLAGSTPEKFAAYIKEEILKYAKLVKERGIRIE